MFDCIFCRIFINSANNQFCLKYFVINTRRYYLYLFMNRNSESNFFESLCKISLLTNRKIGNETKYICKCQNFQQINITHKNDDN